MKKILIGAAVALGVAAAGLVLLKPGIFSKLGVAESKAGKVDYGLFCDEHGVPEKFCTLCHPELKKTLLLCAEHGGLPEDVCTKCHPENAAKYDLKPCEHGLPAHFCPRCHPENFKEGGSASAGPDLVDDGWCAAFGDENPAGGPKVCTFLPMVRLGSAELAEDVGLKTASVSEEEHSHELTANAESAYDANRFAEITPRVRGYVSEARVDLGDVVKAGDVLSVVDSSEVSTAKTQYISADAALKLADDTYRRMSVLAAKDVVPRKEEIATRTALNQAKASLLDAEQRLKNFRFDAAALKEIIRTGDTDSILDVASPIGGTVILRHTVLGEAVEPTANLFTVADVSKLWLWIDVYEQDVAQVRAGQLVTFLVSGISPANESASHAGRITWVGSDVNEKTRTTKVRAEVPNPDGKLRAGQYGKARIRIGEPHKAVLVAKGAVQRYEDVDLVFLAPGQAAFRPQRIKTTPLDRRDVVEVAWGLKQGQVVVTDGSFLLKTEIMKGSIGAGCCE